MYNLKQKKIHNHSSRLCSKEATRTYKIIVGLYDCFIIYRIKPFTSRNMMDVGNEYELRG